MALSRTKEDVMERLQLETPRWDTKVRCACGAEFTSRCEFWRHQALAYEALVSSGFDSTYVDPIIVNIMTRDETARLLDRLKAACGRRWDQDTLREWHGFLQHYGARHCNEALDALVEDGEDGPNLPRFLQTVKQRQPARPALEQPDPCALCDGTGWVWAPPVEHRGYAYTQVQPCRCTTGRRMATVHATILATNGDLT